jgi:hypothetical protein
MVGHVEGNALPARSSPAGDEDPIDRPAARWGWDQGVAWTLLVKAA